MKRIIVLMSLGFCLLASGADAAWKETTKTPEQTKILNQVEEAVKNEKTPVVVFDLDSTLFKNHARWAKIVQEYGALKKIDNLKNFKAEQVTDGWDMRGVIGKDAGNDDAFVKDHIKEFRNFWGERFFADGYMGYDTALPGAVDFVNKLYDLGATVVYITGRDEPNMRKGTVASLKANGFPIEKARTHLYMKPLSNAAMKEKSSTPAEYAKLVEKTDKEFKAGAMAKAKGFGKVVASFDNDPRHINLYFDEFHKTGSGLAVFLDTDHSKNSPEVLKGVVSVNGFLR